MSDCGYFVAHLTVFGDDRTFVGELPYSNLGLFSIIQFNTIQYNTYSANLALLVRPRIMAI